MTIVSVPTRPRPDGEGMTQPVVIPHYVYRLSAALAVAALAAGASTFAFGGLLHATPVMNGSARGTGLVMFGVGVPVLLLAMRSARHGSARAIFVWFGSTMYLAYNAFLQLLGTPLNRLFLLCVAALTLSIASAVALAVTADPGALARRCAPTLPVRGLAIYLWVIVGLNALTWLSRIVPALVDNDPERLLAGTGITMIPTYLQDLAFWLPLLAVAGVWLWHRRPWGYLLVGGGLAMWALEGLTVAVDQWFGSRADPASTVASSAAVVPFLLASLIGAVALGVFLRHVDAPGIRTTRTRA